jgi:hypothetical protein
MRGNTIYPDARIPENVGKRRQIDLIGLVGEHDRASVKSQPHADLCSEDCAKLRTRRFLGCAARVASPVGDSPLPPPAALEARQPPIERRPRS